MNLTALQPFFLLFKWVLEGHIHHLLMFFSWKTVFEGLWENTICHNLRAQTSELDSAIPLNDCLTSPYSKPYSFDEWGSTSMKSNLLLQFSENIIRKKDYFTCQRRSKSFISQQRSKYWREMTFMNWLAHSIDLHRFEEIFTGFTFSFFR
jgi:hypothetical protein